MQRPFDVGEERVAAQAGRQPDPLRFLRPDGAVEADTDALDEYFPARFGPDGGWCRWCGSGL
ncbi:MAG: hypothetical protein ABSB59_09090 [Streptosporangiaceae bacterium]